MLRSVDCRSVILIAPSESFRLEADYAGGLLPQFACCCSRGVVETERKKGVEFQRSSLTSLSFGMAKPKVTTAKLIDHKGIPNREAVGTKGETTRHSEGFRCSLSIYSLSLARLWLLSAAVYFCGFKQRSELPKGHLRAFQNLRVCMNTGSARRPTKRTSKA